MRPCFDFACVVYHSMITRTQFNKLERLQQNIMKMIYGFDESYSRCLARAGIDYLSIRRCKLAEKFALKTAANSTFSHWFPLNEPSQYALRKEKISRITFPYGTVACSPDLYVPSSPQLTRPRPRLAFFSFAFGFSFLIVYLPYNSFSIFSLTIALLFPVGV